MKKAAVLFTTFILIPFLSLSQTLENLDFISPFNDGLAAVKKDGKWAFINAEGTLVIDFRGDLVTTKTKDGNYPVFNADRCLITLKKEGIPYYGYIDTSGKTAIEPQFLNAHNFNNDVALVLLLKRTELSKNVALGKAVVRYDYFEVVIDKHGETLEYLSDANHINLHKEYLVKAPVITSKFLESSKLIATKGKDKKYKITKIKAKY